MRELVHRNKLSLIIRYQRLERTYLDLIDQQNFTSADIFSQKMAETLNQIGEGPCGACTSDLRSIYCGGYCDEIYGTGE